MPRGEIEFTGFEDMKRRITAYGAACDRAVENVGRKYQPLVETYAKTNAAWEDRTGLARIGLRSWVDKENGVYNLYLSHSRFYGVYLETGYQGRYAIIWPTLRHYMPAIQRDLQRVFS